MVCDFFYPNIGGVESHIYQLAQCLIERGHKVVVVTHAYENRKGIRNMNGNLKVYYLPFKAFYKQCIFPSILGTLPLIREIVIREQIHIIHGHSSFSTLAHEGLFHAAVLGCRSVFTDHSLFGFADLSSILTNNVLKFSLNSINHTICVSNTARENTVLRSHLHPVHVSVIPNAIDASQFQPDPAARPKDKIVIVVMSRLVYRRGTDLLTSIIPYICYKYPEVDFLIGGDGDKRILLEEIREEHSLHSRVKLLGMVKHECVRDVMVQGHIFVNTSLTESFCITIVEAASCGLQVITTNVGGVPEVLPPGMVKLATPTPESLTEALEQAIIEEKQGVGMSPLQRHDTIKDIYKWSDVARRTEIVYNRISSQPVITPRDRMNRLWCLGPIFGKIVIMALVLDMLFARFLEWWRPASSIDKTWIYKAANEPTEHPSSKYEVGISPSPHPNGTVSNATMNQQNDSMEGSSMLTPRRSSRLKHRTVAPQYQTT